MHAARMQSTNVEFMGTKCLQRIWKRPSTACRRCGDACLRLAEMRTKGEEIEDISESQSVNQSGGESHWSDGCVRCGT